MMIYGIVLTLVSIRYYGGLMALMFAGGLVRSRKGVKAHAPQCKRDFEDLWRAPSLEKRDLAWRKE